MLKRKQRENREENLKLRNKLNLTVMNNQVNVDISQTQPVTCEECGGVYFEQGLILRKASKFLTGTGQDGFIPIPVFNCKKCGHVNQEFLPKEIKELD
jgi:uncharacterized Zn finger protein